MTSWLAETLIGTTALIVLVLLIRKPVARLFGARAAYALWLAPLFKLLVPSLPKPVADSTVVIVYDPGVVVSAAPAASALPGAGQILLWLWLAGAGLFLVYQYATHHRFISRALRQGRTLEEGPGPLLIESGGVEGPVAVGILRKRIILPPDFGARITLEQRELALAHERLHHERHDLLALAGATVMLAAHWFNPLAHAAYRAFRADQEAACDAQLAQKLSRSQRAAYAEALVRCASAPVPRAICTLTTVEDLKGRLKMLKLNHGRFARVSGAAIAITLAGAGVAVTAQAAPEARKGFGVPAAPLPPAAPAAPAAPLLSAVAPVAPPSPPAPLAPVALGAGIVAPATPAAPIPPAPPAPPAPPQVKSFVIANGEVSPADAKNRRIVSTHRVVIKNGKVVEESGTRDGRAQVRSCNGKQFQASGGSKSDSTSQHSSLFICTEGGKSDAEFANLLERSLSDLESSKDMGEQTRSVIAAQLRAKIAELRSK